MGRLPGGNEVLEIAQQLLPKVTAVDDLRTLQSVIFPLVNGMSTQETANAIGRSPRWVTQARTAFIKNEGFPKSEEKKIRNRAYMTIEEEKAFLEPFFEKAKQSKILLVTEIYEALKQRLGRNITLPTAYNLLHRHGWRKLMPYKRNVATNMTALEEFKKNSRTSLRKLRKNGITQVTSD